MDTAGSRSLGDPWPTPEWFHREENVFSPAEQKVLNSAQQFTIFALNPGGRPTEGEEVAGEFHGFPILGQAEIRNPAERAALLHALYYGIDDSNGNAASCFDPRHGIRVTSNGETVDLVICFACLQVDVYFGNQSRQLLTSRLPQPVFNQAFRNANLPVTRK